MLKPGALLSRCEILRNSNAESDPAADVYVMAFECEDRRYTCPLFRFLPRTHTVVAPAVAEQPAGATVAGC
jgi:hypothetical protein